MRTKVVFNRSMVLNADEMFGVTYRNKSFEMADFGFKRLVIWQEASKIGKDLFLLALHLETHKHFGFGEQLKRASLSISNNIAEGSGACSNKEFIRFLNYSKRSAYECANIIAQLELLGLDDGGDVARLNAQLIVLSARIEKLKVHLKLNKNE